MGDKQWSLAELHEELNRFEQELRSAGFKSTTLQNYVERSNRFLRWLAGDYKPERRPSG